MPALRRAACPLHRLPAPLLRRQPRFPQGRPLRGGGRPLSSSAAAAPRCELEYYSAWFCPFAHRATLALEHHAPSGVDYNWIEALGWSKKDEEELDENSGVRCGPPHQGACSSCSPGPRAVPSRCALHSRRHDTQPPPYSRANAASARPWHPHCP